MPEPALRFLSLGMELTIEDENLLENIHAALDRLTRRRKDNLSLSSSLFEEVLREGLLYRIVATARGIIVNWNTGNVLCSFLCARALFETFAFLWDYERAIKKARETGTLEEFQDLTRRRLAATRNPKWLAIHPEWEATNILTLIDRLSEEHLGLRSAYDQMSYRCHPNTEGVFYMFADLNVDTKTVRFADHNDDAGWAFHLVRAVAGLTIEAEEIFNRLEEATPKVTDELKLRHFKQARANAEREQKEFARFAKEEEKALQGRAGGQFNIGTIYATGIAMVPKNLVLAYMWFSLSAAQGHEKAAKNRDRVARNMTLAQIAEAQKLAIEWKPLTPEQIAEMEDYWRQWEPKPD
jgi:hypothetical protein